MFPDAAALAAELDRVAKRFPAKKSAARSLPLSGDLRLAMNVASCDSMPLVIVADEDPNSLAKTVEKLEQLAWSDDFVGRFRWTTVAGIEELSTLDEFIGESSPGIYMVEPGAFGRAGHALAQTEVSSKSDAWTRALEAALTEHAPAEKERRAHTRSGKRERIEWKADTADQD